MSFILTAVQGTVSELETDLASPANHEREEKVIPVLKNAIKEIVESVGGYLSVSCNGNLNPVAGENGDVINLTITSLTPPIAPSPAEPPFEAPIQPTPVIEETPQPVVGPQPTTEVPAPVVEPTPAPVETPPAAEQTPTPETPQVNIENSISPNPPAVTENSAENPPLPTGEVPPVEPAV